MEYYEPLTDFSDETESIDRMINKVKMDISLISKKYPDIRIIHIDAYQNRAAAFEYRVYKIPVIILYNNKGYEINRWNREDFDRGAGTGKEINSFIEKMINQGLKFEEETNN